MVQHFLCCFLSCFLWNASGQFAFKVLKMDINRGKTVRPVNIMKLVQDCNLYKNIFFLLPVLSEVFYFHLFLRFVRSSLKTCRNKIYSKSTVYFNVNVLVASETTITGLLYLWNHNWNGFRLKHSSVMNVYISKMEEILLNANSSLSLLVINIDSY